MTSVSLEAGDHARTIAVDGRERSYLVHIPDAYDPTNPMPVVLILHGAGTDADITVQFTGMNAKSDEAGFIAVYPNGTGRKPLFHWNSGARLAPFARAARDDVAFIGRLLDDLQMVVHVDRRRVYATGMSNGGMMCYRLAAELSERIAAIAPVAGTMTLEEANPTRPVSVMHFHGMADRIVPPSGPIKGTPKFLAFKSLDETLAIWCHINGCSDNPTVISEPGTTITRKAYGPGTAGAEVIVFEIEDGGHTWPGQPSPFKWLGMSTLDISANDLMWEFFERHPLPSSPE